MDFSGIDQTVDQTLASWHCPGVAIAVVQGDTIVYQRTAGLASLADRRPVTADTRFALASVTKPLTAMSAALLVDEGLLDWDRPVCEDLPAFVLEDPYVTRHVTLRDILSHRTGLPRHDYAAWRLNVSRAEFIRRMRHLKLATSLRERFQYNNLMYAAVGHLVETVAAQRWEKFVQDRIFDPLDMRASNFEPEFPKANHPLADGYRIERDHNGQFSSHVAMPFGQHTELSPGPAGALFSTLGDLTRWLQVHINEGRHESQTLISRSTIREMHSPQVTIPVHETAYPLSGLKMLSYGLGWFVRPYPYAAATLVYHDGNVEGHSAHVGFVPEAKLGVVVLANAASSIVPTVLAREVLDRALELPARDWSGRFHSLHDPIYAAAGKSRQSGAAEEPRLVASSHPLEDFEGHYSADGYPDFAVRLCDGALQACTVGSMPWSPLRHAGYDVFEWYVPAWDDRHTARFTLSEHGEVDAVSLPISGERFDITFKRKPAQVEPRTLAALAGNYQGNIAGMRFEARVANGKLYWTELGLPTVEASARRLTSDAVEFSMANNRITFFKGDAGWDRVQLKTPSAIFEATKINQSAVAPSLQT